MKKLHTLVEIDLFFMKKTTPVLPLFERFIRESEKGKRRKKNGERIKTPTIENYKQAYRNLQQFSTIANFDLRIADASKLNTREYKSEKSYWKKFYQKYTNYLYKKGCHDNYVGLNVKHVRTFFNYLKNEKDFPTGDFQRLFYVRKEEIPIIVLNPDQLKFLIHDECFYKRLTPGQRRIKDIFVFGCTTGLRFSDIFLLTNKQFEFAEGNWYVKVKSKKTKAYSSVRLPDYAVKIYMKYKSRSMRTPLFKPITLFNFNKNLKKIGELAGWVEPITQTREILGEVKKRGGEIEKRFCDLMSSHMMRRTAITTMLILGMPEHLVRNVSGHTDGSRSFYRYVHFAQSYIDEEITKVHSILEQYEAV